MDLVRKPRSIRGCRARAGEHSPALTRPVQGWSRDGGGTVGQGSTGNTPLNVSHRGSDRGGEGPPVRAPRLHHSCTTQDHARGMGSEHLLWWLALSKAATIMTLGAPGGGQKTHHKNHASTYPASSCGCFSHVSHRREHPSHWDFASFSPGQHDHDYDHSSRTTTCQHAGT